MAITLSDPPRSIYTQHSKAHEIDSIGIKALGTGKGFGVWKKNEEENLHKTRKFLAQIFWNNREDAKSLEEITRFLGEEKLNSVIASGKFENFLSLFEDLSADEIWTIRSNENCNPLGYVKTEPYEITGEDVQNLKHYLDDIGFSGSVSLSDSKETYTVTPTNQEFLEDVSFSINSVAKVFTGALVLMTMSPDDLEDKIQLSPSTLSYLGNEKEEIYKHLKKPSLLQTMNHNGGFGDYLREYEKVVVNALEKGESPPIINRPEDFLKFADTK